MPTLSSWELCYTVDFVYKKITVAIDYFVNDGFSIHITVSLDF